MTKILEIFNEFDLLFKEVDGGLLSLDTSLDGANFPRVQDEVRNKILATYGNDTTMLIEKLTKLSVYFVASRQAINRDYHNQLGRAFSAHTTIESNHRRAIARKGARAMHENSPKADAKYQAKVRWDNWQANIASFSSAAKFSTDAADSILDDKGVPILSVKTITGWCTQWKREKDIIPSA